MFFSVAAAAACLSPAPQEPAALHPATAAFVIQMPDVQQVIRTYPTTALGKLLMDPELHAVVGKFMGSPDPVNPIDLAMAEYDKAVANGDMPPLLELLQGVTSMSASVDFGDDDLFGLMERVNGAEDVSLAASQELGIRVIMDFTDAEAAQQMTEVLVGVIGSDSPNGMSFRARAEGDYKIWSFAGDPGRRVMESTTSVMAAGTRLSLKMGNVDSDKFMTALMANSLPANQASALANFTAGRDLFGKAPAVPVAEMKVPSVVEQIVMEEDPEMLPLLNIAETMMGPMGSLMIRGGHWRVGIENGQFVTEGVHPRPQGGPMSGIIGAEPLDQAALSLPHPDALVTSVTSFNPEILAKLFQRIAAEEGEDMEAFEAQFGFRPDTDLIAPLGDAFAYSLPGIKSMVAAPNLMGAIRLKDQARFSKGMDGLMSIAEEMGEDVQVVREEYKGMMMYTLSFTGEFLDLPFDGLPIDPASFFRPTITIMPDLVLMTTLPTHAKKEIRRVLKLKKKNLEAPVHEEILKMGDLNGATTVCYADWPTFTGGIYAALKGVAPMLGAAMGGEMPFDISALPPAEMLTRHFKPTESWMRINGDNVLHYSKSSLGTEVIGLPLAMVGMTSVPMGMRAAPAMEIEAAVEEPIIEDFEVSDHNEVSSHASETEATLQEVAVAITLFQLDHSGDAPATLNDLTTKSDLYPEGYLDGQAVPKDAWSRAFVYTKTADSYVLYSLGADGVDDGGSGDDVTSR